MVSKASLIARSFGEGGAFSQIADKTIAAGNRKLSASALGDGVGGMQTFANMAALIAHTGMVNGDLALVNDLNKIFAYTGTGWFLIATMTNATPTDITGVAGTYVLADDGTATTITAVSTDPDGFPLTWSYAVTTGSLGSIATVSQADNVFTITPSTTEADAGTFSITFSVTDGATGAVSVVSAFTLAFGDDPGRAAFYKGSQTYSNYSNGWVTSYDWTVPAGVTSICVLCIGAGGGGGGGGSRGGGGGGLAWKNHIPVTAGEIWKVNVGTPGDKDGGQSGDAYPLNASTTSFANSGNFAILRAYGGYTNSGATDNQGGYGYNSTSATYGTGTVGLYVGGSGGRSADGKWGGGGGAAGYSGNGGRGGYGTGSYANGVSGSGGGGGGSGSGSAAVGGGGVGRYGQGSNGIGSSTSSGWAPAGGGGSGGEYSQGAGNGEGGNYGGGGGYYGKGGDATVQIIWGRGRSYPNTLTTLSDDT